VVHRPVRTIQAMNDLQRALADALIDFIVTRRLAGRRLTPKERGYVVVIALELGLVKDIPS